MEIFGVTGQGQTRLLNARHLDQPVQPALAGQQLQVEAGFLFRQQFGNADLRPWPYRFSSSSVMMS